MLLQIIRHWYSRGHESFFQNFEGQADCKSIMVWLDDWNSFPKTTGFRKAQNLSISSSASARLRT